MRETTRPFPDVIQNASSAITGVVGIDKPAGITSHDVVNRVRRIFNTRRAGHTGTLDPLATGVLVICLGQATRIAEYLASDRKTYVAEVRFGLTTDSQDISGGILSQTDTSQVTEEIIREILPSFTGAIEQIPPMVSALHHQGKRLYELARQGIEVERKPRSVEIHRLELKSFAPGPNAGAVLEVECSTGTYIRTLAADIGAALRVGAAMATLRRTRSGTFTISECLTLEALQQRASEGILQSVIRSVSEALAHWPKLDLDEREHARILYGQSISARTDEVQGMREGDLAALVVKSGEAVAIARRRGSELAPIKVFG